MAPELQATSPLTGELKKASALYVCDHANLKGAGAGKMYPAKEAYVWKDGGFHAFWPGIPVANIPAVTQNATDWRRKDITISGPGATLLKVEAFSGTTATGTAYPIRTVADDSDSFSWDWFNWASAFQPGEAITLKLTASNVTGYTVDTTTFTAPAVPKPTGLRITAVDTDSMTLDWDAVWGTEMYQLLNMDTGTVKLWTPSAAASPGGLEPSKKYSWAVRAQVRATYAGAALKTGYVGGTASATTHAVEASGAITGVYPRIEPASNATYQWGESGGQGPMWRPTTDDLYHGDGGSTSSRGKQAAFFFYGTRIDNAFPDGLGTSSVTKLEIYIKRLSSGGVSGATGCRWYMHNHRSRPSGAPGDLSGAQDIASLAWGEGEWVVLPDGWGEKLISGEFKGILWGFVAGRYMQADNSLSLEVPNGSLRFTIGS